MQLNLTTILILLSVLFAGYGIGLLEMHLRRQKKIKALEAALQAEQDRQEIAPASPPPEPSLLRLWADADGALKLELDGAPVDSPASTTPEQRCRLIALLTQVRPWLEGGQPAPAAATASVPAPVPAPKPAPAAKGKAAEPPVPAAAKSIVAQIDDVLQSRLPGTPLAARGVRLGETPGGGVLVYIGADHYDGIEAVPDPDVVSAIRAAIAEWEKR
jgi:hypothetical protein